MTVTKEQARRIAQILYPTIWQSNPVDAVARAIEFLHEAALGPLDAEQPDGTASPKMSAVVRTLAEVMRKHKMHINVISRAVGVSAYTVRTWLEGKYTPSEENAGKIANFLEQLKGTPEILTPEI